MANDPFAEVEAQVAQGKATPVSSEDPFAAVEAQVAKQATPTPTTATPAPASVTAAEADPFAAVEAQVAAPVQPGSQPTEEPSVWSKVKEIPGRIYDDIKARPNFSSGVTTDAELQAIADKHQVPLSKLREMTPLYGGKTEGDRDYFREAEGLASESALLGIPTFLNKKFFSSPNEQKAYDELNSLTESKKSKGQMALEAVAPGAGSIGAGARGLKAVGLTAAAAAAQGLAESEDGHEAQGALLGGVLGAGLGAAGEGVARVFSKPKAVESVAKSVTNEVEGEGRKLSQRLAEGMQADKKADAEALKLFQEAPVKEGELTLPARTELAAYAEARNVPLVRAEATFEQETREFAKTLQSAKARNPAISIPSLEEAKKLIRDAKLSQGPEELARRFDEYRQTKKAIDLFKDATDTKVKLRTGENPIKEWAEAVIDGTHAARALDYRMGTPVERILTDMSQANNLFTRDLHKAVDGLAPLDAAFRKSGLDAESLYKRLDTGDFEGLTTEQLAVANGYKQKFKAMAEDLRKLGVPLQERTNYVPRQMVPITDAIVRLDARAKALGEKGIEQFADLNPGELLEARKSNPILDDVVKGIEAISHTDVRDGKHLVEEFHFSLDPQTAGASSDLVAGAAKQRLDVLPDFLLEKNPSKLVANWASSNFKAVRMQPGLSELRRIRNIADAAGEAQSAAYIQTLITDLTGRREKSLVAFAATLKDKKLVQFKKLAEAAPEGSTSKDFYSFMTEAPDFMGTLYNQIYANVLGLKPKAVVQNLLQPFLVTIPELGERYGTMKVAKAYGAALKRVASGGPGPIKLAEDAGFVGIQFSTELRDAVKGGIKENSFIRHSEAALNKFSGVAMKMFEWSESVNRAVTYELGKDIANDLMKGSGMAEHYLRTLPAETRRGIVEAVNRKDAHEAERLMTNYVMNKTQFNYNKIMMSQLGRSLGPLFSTFSKWPVTIAGDIYTTMQRKGAYKGSTDVLRRYYGPAFAAAALSTYVFGAKPSRYDEDGDENQLDKMTNKLPGLSEQSERQKVAEHLLFGQGSGLGRGAGGGAPLNSLQSMASGKVFAGPLVQTVATPIQALIAGDAKALGPLKKSFVNTFVPVYGPMSRAWTETLPALQFSITGQGENPYSK